MSAKIIAWETGTGNLTLTYSGQGNDTVSVTSDDNLGVARSKTIVIETTSSPTITKNVTIYQAAGAPAIQNFSYTGSVQSCTLPAGIYRLQCWGAQGGSVSGTYTAAGSKGGYSEGIIALSQATTVYIFVGGKGTDVSTSTTTSGTVNGGWNGGGGSVRKSESSSASNGYTYGISYPRGGGGGTDIALVTSSMSYSSGVTQRSSASLLSRFIVAGGGGGATASYYETESTQVTETITSFSAGQFSINYNQKKWATSTNYLGMIIDVSSLQGETCVLTGNVHCAYTFAKTAPVSGALIDYATGYGDVGYNGMGGKTSVTMTVPSDAVYMWVQINGGDTTGSRAPSKVEFSTTVTGSGSALSNGTCYGGGLEGGGTYPGRQSDPGYTQAGFGYGATQTYTTTKFASGGGGGGWYGGSINSNSQYPSTIVNTNGGGSGFVNISANAQYRPSNYTGLELLQGTTIAGTESFESTSGSSETGHEGNGYARISNLYASEALIKCPLSFDILTNGTITWKASNSSLTRTIKYRKNYGEWTSITSTTSGVSISVVAGDLLQFAGDNSSYGTSSYYNYFTATANFNVWGNIMSLISSTSFATATTISSTYALRSIFTGNTHVLDASRLQLPATTLNTYSYYCLFYNCSNLVNGVKVLPATSLGNRCYGSMYSGCSSLVRGSDILATTLVSYSLYYMYSNCTSLKYIKCLATSGINSSSSTTNFTNNVPSGGVFVKASGASWPTGVNGIPSGWDVVSV